ncbi:hypothetical protein HK100_005858 [Physocladia obscura]|uniref:Uncharacterized protein n=1 Tax=Physocladia obscura TaxID=109957 RepID=A0AAD5T5S9_9FUNG|nr:hypothetical protein HK100_005858 [Physocladia obscura]
MVIKSTHNMAGQWRIEQQRVSDGSEFVYTSVVDEKTRLVLASSLEPATDANATVAKTRAQAELLRSLIAQARHNQTQPLVRDPASNSLFSGFSRPAPIQIPSASATLPSAILIPTKSNTRQQKNTKQGSNDDTEKTSARFDIDAVAALSRSLRTSFSETCIIALIDSDATLSDSYALLLVNNDRDHYFSNSFPMSAEFGRLLIRRDSTSDASSPHDINSLLNALKLPEPLTFSALVSAWIHLFHVLVVFFKRYLLLGNNETKTRP